MVKKAQQLNKVFITGMGSVTPIGHALEDTLTSLREARSGVVSIHDRLHPEIPSRIAGAIQNAPIDDYVSPREQRRMDRFCQLGMVAGVKAWEHAGIKTEDLPDKGENVGVLAGIGMGGVPYLLGQQDLLRKSGPRRVSPLMIPIIIPNIMCAFLSMRLGLKGVGISVVSACASSAHAIGEAFQKIQGGHNDVILTGGTEAVICDLTIAGFCNMKALSTGYNETPTKASRPFDEARDGFVMAEGAAFLVLESEAHMEKRGATPVAEVVGYGASQDAHHITQPAPEGEGGKRAMDHAFQTSGIEKEQVTYVNAHGTSTPVGDELELLAISKVMGEHAKNVKVSSTKSLTGHMLGAAGAAEAIFSILAMNNNFLPPTLNLDNPVDSCGLNIIGPKPEDIQTDLFMTNSFGFGGTNASLLIKKVT
jgi:3-oxoacyl-[acyl-carrier-protein] synthase II